MALLSLLALPFASAHAQAPVEVQIGAVAAPSITVDTTAAEGGAPAGVALRFGSYEPLAEGQTWTLQRSVGAGWTQVYRGAAATYDLDPKSLPALFRVSTCRGIDRCSDFSLPVTVTLTPTGDGPTPVPPVVTLTPTWSNPNVASDGQMCPATYVPPSSDWIGRIAGTPAVDAGTASYSLPIEVPPGRSGMQPSVSLVYSSDGGAGIAGVGWSLSAHSSIRRCSRTVARDGVPGPVLVDGVDRLCLDGSPLILESGLNGYGGNGAQYRSELNKLDRVQQINNSIQVTGNLHACFEVRTKSGRIRRYGRCADPLAQAFERETIVGANGQPLTFTVAWLLAREEDQQGNAVDYRYTHIDGRPYLSAIHYTGQAGVLGNRRVTFEYWLRPDIGLGFEFRGIEQRVTQRLRGISTYVDNTLVRRYELAYKQSAATGRSLLQSVTLCDDDTYDPHRPECVPSRSLPPTRFAYHEDPPELGYEYERVPLLSHGTGWQESTSDFDGDGTKDKFEVTLESPRGTPAAVTDADLVLSNGGSPLRFPLVTNGSRVDLVPGFRDVSEANVHRYRLIYNLKLPIDGDLDQDGRTDLLGVANGNLAIASWDGSQFVVAESNLAFTGTGSAGVRLLDFNADGKTDVLQNSTVHLQCATVQPGPGAAAPQFCNAIALPFGALPNGHRLTMVRDFNGDGLPDFLFDTLSECESSTWGNPDGVAPDIFMSKGAFSTNVAQSYQWESLAYIDPVSLFAKDDGTWPSCHERTVFRAGDFNGDGLPDLVKVGRVALQLWMNHGGRFVQYSHNAGAFAMPDAVLARAAVIADFDHDGSDEILVPVANEYTYSRLVSDPVNADVDEYSSDGTGQPPYDDGKSDFWTATGSRYQDRALYRWDALDVTFTSTSPATATIIARATNFVGTQFRSAFQDWSNDGLQHGVIYIDSEYGSACAAPLPKGNGCSLASAISDYLSSAGTEPGYCEESIPIVERENCVPTATIGMHQGLPAWTAGYSGETISVVQNSVVRRYLVPPGSGQFLARQTAGHPDKLTEVVDGLGQTARWRYAPLSSGGDPWCDSPRDIPFYTASYGATPRDGIHSLFTSAKLVVSRFSTDNGTGSENHLCYRYEDAWWNNQGRGFLGFARVLSEQDINGDVADDANDLRVETLYETRFPLAGKVCDSKTFLASDAIPPALGCAVASGSGGSVPTPGPVTPLQWTSTVWRSSCAFDVSRPAGENAQSCFVYADSTRDETFDPGTRASVAIKTSDPSYLGTGLMRGNPSTVETRVSDAYQQQRTLTTYSYNYTAPSNVWWINRLERVTVDADPIVYADGSLASEPAKRVVRRYEYFPNGGPTSRLLSGEYLQEGVSGQWHQTLFEYDAFGNVRFRRESADAAAPRTSEVRYTADGYFKNWSSNPEGHWREFEFEPATGLQLVERDQTGRRWTRANGPFGRLITETAPGLPAAHHRVWRCDASCGPLAAYRVARVQAGTPTTVKQLDRLDRVLREQATAFGVGAAPAQWVTVDRVFAPRGYLIRQAEPGLLSAAAPGYTPVATASTRYQAFDALGRVGRKVVEKPDLPFTSMTTTYTYDGLTTKITLPNSLLVSRSTDASGRYVETSDARSRVMKFRYDPLGNLALIEDPDGNQTRAAYDALQRVTAMEDPDRGIHVFAYDGYGLLRGRIDGRGTQVAMRYDDLGRMTERDVDGVPQTGWSYDATIAGALDSELPLTTASNDFRRDIAYDRFGRVIQTTTSIDQRTFVVTHGYDCDGQLAATRYPSGKEVGFEHTDTGYLEREDDYGYVMGNPAKFYRSITGMNARGSVTAETFGSGARGAYSFYESTGQTRDRAVRSPGNSLLNSVTYVYGDAFANLTLQNNTRLNVAESYLYDELQRLTKATTTWTNRPTRIIDYRYDDAGNVTYKSDYALGYEYGDATRSGPSYAGPHGMRNYAPLSGPLVADFRYDANGNLLVGDGRTAVFDAFNRPTGITFSGNTVNFVYAPGGERVKRVEGTTVTYYVEGKLYEHVEDATGMMTMRHYVGPSVLATLARSPLDPTGTEKVHYLHLDRLGSPETITTGTGTVDERHAYDPFGAPRQGSNWTNNGWVRSPSVTQRGYTAHDHVDPQRVIHMNGRVYDYRLARFLSPDPFVVRPLDIQSHNPYSYILNNPYSGTDPTGFCFVDRERERQQCPPDAGTDDDSQWIGAHGVRTATSSAADDGEPDGGAAAGNANNTGSSEPADRGEGGAVGPPCDSRCRYRASDEYAEDQRRVAQERAEATAELDRLTKKIEDRNARVAGLSGAEAAEVISDETDAGIWKPAALAAAIGVPAGVALPFAEGAVYLWTSRGVEGAVAAELGTTVGAETVAIAAETGGVAYSQSFATFTQAAFGSTRLAAGAGVLGRPLSLPLGVLSPFNAWEIGVHAATFVGSRLGLAYAVQEAVTSEDP